MTTRFQSCAPCISFAEENSQKDWRAKFLGVFLYERLLKDGRLRWAPPPLNGLFNEIEDAEEPGKGIGLRVKAKTLPAGSYSFTVNPYLT